MDVFLKAKKLLSQNNLGGRGDAMLPVLAERARWGRHYREPLAVPRKALHPSF
jgi:hypothetical protein